jgi:P27 family predicted phage terminase small subunit
MGKRGPAPTPVALKLLRGNPGRRPINRAAPEPTPGLPVRPVGMSILARRVWTRIIRDYGATGVLTGVDADSFRIYCEAVVRYEGAAMMLEKSGPLVRGARNGELVKNPLHQVVRDNADLVRAFARELGFTPSARSALTDVKKAESGDPLDRWMSGT